MSIDAQTQLFALIGSPITNSLSPFIHNFVFESLGINRKYLAFNVVPETLEETLKGFEAIGVGGFNATMPHKIKLIEHMDEVDPYGIQLGAINTVLLKDGKRYGYNTDGAGLIYSLEDHAIEIANTRVLIIGAGGAAHGIAMALSLASCPKIAVYNRSIDKAQHLIDKINKTDTCGLLAHLEMDLKEYDLIINTSAIGMSPLENVLPIDVQLLNPEAVIYDIVYKPSETAFIKSAREHGNKVILGIEMLIYQALIAEEIWLEKELPKREMKEQIMEKLIEAALIF